MAGADGRIEFVGVPCLGCIRPSARPPHVAAPTGLVLGPRTFFCWEDLLAEMCRFEQFAYAEVCCNFGVSCGG